MPSQNEDVFEHLHALMHLFKQGLRAALEADPAHGALGPMEMRALGFIARHPGATQSELVAHSGRDKAQIARLIGQLESRDLLLREPDEQDRRSHRIRLSAQGEALQTALNARRKTLVAGMLRDFNAEERRQLQGFLARMRANVHSD